MSSAKPVISREFPVFTSPTLNQTATIIFCHGAGSNGRLLRNNLNAVIGKEFSFPHIKIIFPTATAKKYTLAGGKLWNVWFDQDTLNYNVEGRITDIQESCDYIHGLVQEEIQLGIPKNRIIVAGFSMGGCLCLQYASIYGDGLAGILSMSSFLDRDSFVYESLKDSKDQWPPVLQCHGQLDDIIPYKWGEQTFKDLSKLGVQTKFLLYANVQHEFSLKELHDVRSWITDCLPA